MPELYLLAKTVTAQLERQHDGDAIGLIRAKGALATRTGFLVSLITPNDPDDSDKLARLRQAASEMGIAL